MMSGQLKIGVPSKGRLMEDTLELFRAAGLAIEKSGDERGYRGFITAMPGVTVEFLSAGEIARHLQLSRIHLGVTGEDLNSRTHSSGRAEGRSSSEAWLRSCHCRCCRAGLLAGCGDHGRS